MKTKAFLIPLLFALTGAGFSAATVFDPQGPAGAVKPCRECGYNDLCTAIAQWSDCLMDSDGVHCIGERARTERCDIGDDEDDG
jgi:hypothetical protein